MRKRWLDLLAMGIFGLLVASFFYPTLLKGKLPVPTDTLVGMYHPWRDLYAEEYPRGIPFKNFLITDPVRQQIPWRKVAIDQWKQGNLPGWNPYSFSGMPLAANIQAAAFYPLNLLFFWFDFASAWTVLIILQPLLAGIFLYWYLRNRQFTRLASLFGALVWSFSGFNLAWLTWGTMGQVALWLPLILLAIDKLLLPSGSGVPTVKLKVIWLAVLALGLIMQFLAGHSQISFYILTISTVYFIWHHRQTIGKYPSVAKKFHLWSLVAIALILILTSPQWLPILRFLPESSRLIATDNWKQPGWFIPWQNLVQFIAPDFFGNPATLNYWGIWNYAEFIGYLGITALLFAVCALRTNLLWTILLAVCLIFALPNPVSFLVYQLRLPGISAMQPTRLLVIIDFVLAVLAASGLNSWLKTKPKISRLGLGIFSLIFGLLWLLVLGRNYLSLNLELRSNLAISQRNLILPTVIFGVTVVIFLAAQFIKNKKLMMGLGVLLLAISSLDLFRFGWKFTPFTSGAYFFPQTRVINFLKQAQPKPFRVMSLDKRILPPNTGAYFGIETIEGYDPLYSSRYEKLLAALSRGQPDLNPPYGFNRILVTDNLDSPLLPLFNIRYILTLSEVKRPFLAPVFQEGETRVYEDLRFLPRAFWAEKVLSVKDEQAEITELFRINARTTAVSRDSFELIDTPLAPEETVNFTEYTDSNLILETRSAVPRMLVIVNPYDPGWKAQIDKQKTQIYRVNYLFQGILVPAGNHRIRLNYSIIP